MKWFLFLWIWFYDFSFNFQSCLSIHRPIRLFARILSVFVLSSIIINPFRSDFWFVLIYIFFLLLRISHLYDLSKSTAHSDCHLWLIKLSRRRSNLRLLNRKCLLSALRTNSMRKVDLRFVADACKVSKTFHLTVITNWRINFGALKLVSFPFRIPTKSQID